VARIYGLPKSRAYGPILREAPTAWVLSLVHTAGGYDGPGRMAFDSQGNIWVTNNFEPPGSGPGLGVISLGPTGAPRNGSPVTGGGIKGVWWGIAIDQRDRVWLSNFIGDDTADFYSPDFVGGTSVALFTSNGRALSPAGGITAGDLHAPQGMAVDPRGNVWTANHGTDTVTLYPGGDPAAARVISGGGLYNPFTIVTDAQGNAWVDNGSLDPSAQGSITRIGPDGQAHAAVTVNRMRSPQGMAIDSAGDLWIASLVDSSVTWLGRDGRVKGQFRAPSIEGAWGLAIDGDDNVWVASFIGKTVTKLCGRTRANCPAGLRTGDPISPRLHGFDNGGLQHVTAVQVDASGHAWVANNWSRIVPITGGNGLVQFIGVAAPVRTPMIGLPARPGAR
jgi:streptogramin lyase